MKKQLHKLRRFFARTGGKKLNAATARDAAAASYEDEDNSSRLSGAFVVVLVLHVIALVGVFFYSRMMDRQPGTSTAGKPAETALPPASVQGTPQLPVVPKSNPQSPLAAAGAQATERPQLPTPTPLTPKVTGRTYIVKSGDNLSIISTVLGVRAADLKAANQLTSDDLRIGQELQIPEARLVKTNPETRTNPKISDTKTPASEKPTPAIYTMKKGDTLVKIAREYGVSYEEMIKLNKISDPKKIQLNQKIKIPKKN